MSKGYIQEITVQGKSISVTLTPSDEFSVGSDESIHPDCKKMVIVHGDKHGADLVGLDAKFIVSKIDLNMVYAMKKDRTKLRVFVEEVSSSDPAKHYTITSITVL